MDNIVKYNTLLLKYILIGVLLITIFVIGIGMIYKWNKWHKYYYNKNKNTNTNEHFSQIGLEKQVTLYDDYRDYLNGKHLLDNRRNRKNRQNSKNSKNSKKRLIPYKINRQCFNDKYRECLDKHSKINHVSHSLNNYHSLYYPVGFDISSRTCQKNSIDSCLI